MEIKSEIDYKNSLKHRADLLEAYSFLGSINADDLDKQISEVNAQIALYEAQEKELTGK
ncbi:hypothetical protein KO527_05275 [Pseudoalteromonas sp. C2R02]|uniref:hypothetical protein n=1 Tax=Pseudoalteromonas sp. C2R02 TaxID=2841565 RepID=UPI001C087547|nr:hypothetical protein [Pseudoalteromonas sp. C2R02]MBU2968759.1 hypothetical protein [Pseudoalteromonas sp. C2R02]